MADFYQTVIDTQARTDDVDHLARHVVAFLAGKGVIAAAPSEEGGYPRGPQAMEISEAVRDRPGHEAIPPVHTHLQVMIGRATHSADMSDARPPKAHCPECGWEITGLEDEWSVAVNEWLMGDDESFLDCATCRIGAPVARWDYGSSYGFGNLAFRFWNWPPLRGDFLEELGKELGHPVALVRGKL